MREVGCTAVRRRGLGKRSPWGWRCPANLLEACSFVERTPTERTLTTGQKFFRSLHRRPHTRRILPPAAVHKTGDQPPSTIGTISRFLTFGHQQAFVLKIEQQTCSLV